MTSKKSKIIFALTVILTLSSSEIFSQCVDNWHWGKEVKGTPSHVFHKDIEAINGYIYVTGGAKQNVIFENDTLAADGIHFVSKYDASGNLIDYFYNSNSKQAWAGNINSTIDSSGNIYSLGMHGGSLEFQDTVINIQDHGVYLVKRNLNGGFEWCKYSYALTGYYGGSKEDVEIDPNQNVYMLKSTKGATVFSDGDTMTSPNSQAMLRKYDTNGALIWHKVFGQNNESGEPLVDMELGENGNLYILGVHSDDIEIDSTIIPAPSNGYGGYYLLKIAPDGQLLSYSAYETEYVYNSRAFELEYDKKGHFYINAVVNDYISSGDTTINIKPNTSAYAHNAVVKVDTTGSLLDVIPVFTNAFFVSSYSSPFGSLDYHNNELWVSGIFVDTLFINDTIQHYNPDTNLAIIQMDTTGTIISLMETNVNDGKCAIYENKRLNNSTYIAGNIFPNANFIIGNDSIYGHPSQTSGLFAKTCTQNANYINTYNNQTNYSFKLYPNPTSHELVIETPEFKAEEIYIADAMGKIVLKTNRNLNRLNVRDLPPGTYFVSLVAGNKTLTKPFVKK